MRRALVIFAFLLWPLTAAAGDVTRQQVVEAMAPFGLLAEDDFQEYRLADGTPAVKAVSKDSGVMVAIIGPPEDVREVAALAGARGDTSFDLLLMLASAAAVAAEWPEGSEWVLKAVTETAGRNGGSKGRTVNGHSIMVETMPPAIVRLSVARQ